MKSKFESVQVGDNIAVHFCAVCEHPRVSVMGVVKVTKTSFTVRSPPKSDGTPTEVIRFRKLDGESPTTSSLAARWVVAAGFATPDDVKTVERQRFERKARAALKSFADRDQEWSAERSQAVLAFCATWGGTP